MRVLGVDPGSLHMGWGIIEGKALNQISRLRCGRISVPAKLPFNDRLAQMSQNFSEIFSEEPPDVVVLESIFLGKNVDSAFKLGHIRGICVVECQRVGAQVFEYSPREVKKSITGSGGSDKSVLRQNLYSQLGVVESGHSLDASDALAIAFCHHLQDQVRQRLRPMEGM